MSLQPISGPTIRTDIARVDASVIEAARTLPAATLHEAGGRIGVLPSVHPGDLVVGDTDGVVCIPRESAPRVVEASQQRETKEVSILRRLEAGERTLEVYNF